MAALSHNSAKWTLATLVQECSLWETHIMVLVSFLLQIYLLLTGSLRRSLTSRTLRLSIWLAYLGADYVAVYALGLFSKYDEKYGSTSVGTTMQPFEDTLPFLWVPFLIVHLGGQDSITAFSMEDNNLWLRHLLNLGIQGALALYVFWKSYRWINSSILVPAMFVYVCGIIKYGERTWALKTASREGLGTLVKVKSSSSSSSPEQQRQQQGMDSKASYALQMVLRTRGLFVGRTVLQLGRDTKRKIENDFGRFDRDARFRIVGMELDMMFDLLYTKANVLHAWVGVLLRCLAQVALLVAFVLFLVQTRKHHQHHHRNSGSRVVNFAISYTLFAGAIFVETCSVAAVVASPWTRARLREGTVLHRLSTRAWSVVRSVQGNRTQWTTHPMGQFNFMDTAMAERSHPGVSKAVRAVGLEKQWRNLWYIGYVEGNQGIFSYVTDFFDRSARERFGGQLQLLDRRLNYTLCLPFEHALYRLHLYTDLHIARYLASTGMQSGTSPAPAGSGTTGATITTTPDAMQLVKECERLSNYMMYLMVVQPSMLPVSTAAEDLEPSLVSWVGNHTDRKTKLELLEEYAARVLGNERDSPSPFEPARTEPEFKRSLEQIREMWVRLLVFAAGKCRGELHARQLGEGGELLTFVWLQMVHRGLGDVAQELSLFRSDIDGVPQFGSLVSVDGSNWIQSLEGPCYAFDFRQQQGPPRTARERRRSLA